MQQQTEPRGVEVEIVHWGKHRPEEREPMTPTEEFHEGIDWLHYARAQAQLLANQIGDAKGVDLEDTALAVEGVASMVMEAIFRIERAHALLRWQWAPEA